MRELVKTRLYKAGYEIRYERISDDEAGGGAPFIIRSAHTIPEGYYIGDSGMAHRLIVKMGIKPQPRLPPSPESNGGKGRTCTIGFCESKQKWAGWSHRAIAYFGIGDRIFEAPYGDEDSPFTLHGGVVIEELAQAKQAAENFAEYVS